MMKENFINKEFIDDTIFLEYIKEEIIKRNLKNYIENIIFDKDDKNEYSVQDKRITINLNDILFKSSNIIKNMITKKEQNNGIIKDMNNVNIYNLYVINHELEHANQVKLLNTLDPDEHLNEPYIIWRYLLLVKDILLENNSIIYFNDMPYKVYHDYYMSEYDANINSYINTLNFINSLDLKKINKNIEKFNMIIAKNLLYLYRDIENKRKFSTPSKNFIKLHNHIRKLLKNRNIDNPENFFDEYEGIEKPSSQIERLKLGFQISKDTYEYLTLVSKNKHKTLNLFNDIMNL